MCLSYTHSEFWGFFNSNKATRMKISCRMVSFWLQQYLYFVYTGIHGSTKYMSTQFKILYFLTLKASRQHYPDSITRKAFGLGLLSYCLCCLYFYSGGKG